MAEELIPFEQDDERSYNDQINDALHKALEIHGTTLSDLQDAMNAILQMERALRLCSVPNPYEAVVKDLKVKYKMGRYSDDAKFNQDARKLLERGDGGLAEGNTEQLELVEGEVIEDDDA